MTRDKFPWNLNPMTRKMHNGVKRLNTICDGIISDRQAEQHAARPRGRSNLLDKLLHLDLGDLRGNLITGVSGYYFFLDRFLIAGSDTTAIAVSWCLYYLSLNPHIQTEASAEVGGLGRDPKTRADLNDLAYVECCLLETLRLQPPGRFLFHECISDSLLVGKPIPSSTIVGALLRGAMVAECGTSFKPERWLIPGSSEIDRVLVRDHLAFGGGPRQCPGQNMAIKDATMVLALILQYFDDIKLNHSPESVRGKATLTCGSKNLELRMYTLGIPWGTDDI